MTIDTYMEFAKASQVFIELDNLLLATTYRNEHGACAIVISADLRRRIHECVLAEAGHEPH